MIICGLKLTHDGAIALIEDGRLRFSIEMEKLENNPRFTSIEDTSIIPQILETNGYKMEDVDLFVVDGWGGYDQESLAIQPRLEIGELTNKLSADDQGVPYQMGIAQYRERTLRHDLLEEWSFDGLKVQNKSYNYSSFLHSTGHVMSTYSTSPFAKRGESSYILVWDGGMYPRLYFYDAAENKVKNFGPIFLLIGNIYTIFAQHFGPFKVKGKFAKDNLSIAGKVMAYIALGQEREELLPIFEEIYETHYNSPMGFANIFANEFKKKIEGQGYSDEDILCTFHKYIETLLISKLEKKISRYDHDTSNICLAGGCALNIKWNRAIRNYGLFNEVYVSPFPNDSGSAIGAACAAMVNHTGNAYLDWDVYSGPAIIKNSPAGEWTESDCTPKELASLLFENEEPVVFLNGRAELGPRALGNRSILASPISPRMKEILNVVKKRETYRPISPICLEEFGPQLFTPGGTDPYMLFDHEVTPEWLDKIPAICHLDNSARLQTITAQQNPVIAELLTEFYNLSGVPLLCNTSANYNGSGFFPDVQSVTEWDRVNYVWCENTLYTRNQKLSLLEDLVEKTVTETTTV